LFLPNFYDFRHVGLLRLWKMRFNT